MIEKVKANPRIKLTACGTRSHGKKHWLSHAAAYPHRYAGKNTRCRSRGFGQGRDIAEPDGSAGKKQSVFSKAACSRSTSMLAGLAQPVFTGGPPGQGVLPMLPHLAFRSAKKRMGYKIAS
jgi:hypothetical protein